MWWTAGWGRYRDAFADCVCISEQYEISKSCHYADHGLLLLSFLVDRLMRQNDRDLVRKEWSRIVPLSSSGKNRICLRMSLSPNWMLCEIVFSSLFSFVHHNMFHCSEQQRKSKVWEGSWIGLPFLVCFWKERCTQRAAGHRLQPEHPDSKSWPSLTFFMLCLRKSQIAQNGRHAIILLQNCIHR